MMPLATLQARFLAALSPHASAAQLTAAQGLLADNQGLSAAASVQVYRTMYRLRLTEALRSDYEMTHRGLGAARFAELAARHLAAAPPDSASLDAVSRGFATTLDASPTVPPQWVALAELEWARAQVFTRLASPPCTFAAWQKLGEAAATTLHFRLNESLLVGHYACDVSALWRSLAYDDGAPPAPAGAPCDVAVWRQGRTVCHRRLEVPERDALAQVQAGQNFLAVCGAYAAHRVPSQTVLERLQCWFQDGWIVGMLAAPHPQGAPHAHP